MSQEKMDIRKVQEKDAERISEINLICWKTAYRGIIEDQVLDTMTLTPERLKRFQEGIKQIPIYLCAEKEGKIIGYIAGGKTEGMPYPYEVKFLYVHPDFQRQGVGKSLINAFKKEIDYHDFYLYMLDGNEKATAFYERMGGVRKTQYDTDTIVRKLRMHDLCFVFEKNK